MNHSPGSLICEGFKPSEDFLHFAALNFEQICESAPSDATVNGRIAFSKADHMYHVAISIRGANRTIEFEQRDHSLETLFRDAIDDVTWHLHEWHAERFEEVVAATDLENFARHVLIVDDDPFSTRLLENCFKMLGCNTRKVATAQAALYQLMNEVEKFDLVVMDWQLTEMTGGQLMQLADFMLGSPNDPDYEGAPRLPVLAYSSTTGAELNFSDYANFNVVERVNKMTGYPELLKAARTVVSQLPAARLSA